MYAAAVGVLADQRFSILLTRLASLQQSLPLRTIYEASQLDMLLQNGNSRRGLKNLAWSCELHATRERMLSEFQSQVSELLAMHTPDKNLCLLAMSQIFVNDFKVFLAFNP